MDEFASSQETQRALGILLNLQEDPETLEGFFNKYPGANPFTSWPFPKRPTEAFLRYFETTGAAGEQGAQAAALLPNNIEEAKLNELVEEFDREFADAKAQRVNAATASKKFVRALVENAKKSNVTISETIAGGSGAYPEQTSPQAPAPQEIQGAPLESVPGWGDVWDSGDQAESLDIFIGSKKSTLQAQEAQGTPVTPERIREIAVAAIQRPGPPEEKELFFHALTSFASEQPDRDVKVFVPRAAEVTDAAKVLSASIGTFPGAPSFSALATNNFQKGAAGILDAVVPTAEKGTIINKILLKPLDTIVNHPETLPPNVLATMTDRWGTNFVNSAWFTRLRTDANRMMGDQGAALKITSRFTAIVSDVATTVFRGPPIVNVITYMETYRITTPLSYTVVSVSHYGNIALGYGQQLLRMGTNYVMKKAIKAGVKEAATKAAVSTAMKVGAEAVAGASTGGIATLAMIASDFAKGLLRKGAAILKSLLFMGNSKNPEDNLILVAMVGIVAVFFLPLFPLINTPSFNQSMVDTSIATNAGGGMTGGPTVNCQLTPDDPLCSFIACTGDCRWPTSGYITQGPNTAVFCSVSTSHSSGSAANGIDIASFSGGPVYTPRAGTVVEAYAGCVTNSGHLGDTCGGSPSYAGYGNHVILKTDDGYTLIFAHLESTLGVQAGQHVNANAQLGWMDQTGNSSGAHLHFGVLSGGNVLDFVPTGDSALSPEAISGCVTTAGCTKPCPSTPVKAGS